MLASLALSYTAYRRRPPARLPANVRTERQEMSPLPANVLPGGIKRVGLVRFNPYHDTGGEYSFTVALLDDQGAGVLLTGLYHRDQSRVYAKEVAGWTSQQELMDEEREAIERARARPDL